MSFDWNLSSDEEDLETWQKRHELSSTAANNEDENNGEEEDEGGAKAYAGSTWDLNLKPMMQNNKNRNDEGGGKYSNSDGDGDDDDNDSVDWEDAEDAAPESDNLKAVTIDFRKPSRATATTQKENKKKSQKQRRRPQRYRFARLAPPVQRFLQQLHQTSLLCEMGRARHGCVVATSGGANDDDDDDDNDECDFSTAIAASLLPLELSLEIDLEQQQQDQPWPTPSRVQRVAQWFTMDLLNRSRRWNASARAPRRRPRKRPRRSSSSSNRAKSNSDSDDDDADQCEEHARLPLNKPNFLRYAAHVSSTATSDSSAIFGPEFPTALWMSVCRALGWRVRWVQALQPIPTDLDVDHPLLRLQQQSLKSLLSMDGNGGIARTSPNVGTPDLSDENDRKPSAKASGPSSLLPPTSSTSLEWVEVLTQTIMTSHKRKSEQGGRPSRPRWIHVDPARRLVDRPDQVEALWAQTSAAAEDGENTGTRKQRRRRKAVAYVIAVEAAPLTASNGNASNLRYTDVTPRYAQQWTETLRARGHTANSSRRRAKAAANGNPPSPVDEDWWTRTLQQMNSASSTNKLPSASGATQDEAIVLDDDDDDDDKPSLPTENSNSQDDVDDLEQKELRALVENEALPTSKAAFKTHPVYALESELNSTEVLAPDAKTRVCGVFKGKMVYRRSDVSTAYPAKRWFYEGRQVKDGEKPIKRVKARKKAANAGFQALTSYGVGDGNDGSEIRREQDMAAASRPLEDGMQDLFAVWQTQKWSPAPVGPHDPIPVNEYRNIELELLNPGLVHVDQTGSAAVAKKLGIPYAPCLLGFEGHQGNRTPTIRGIVVHEHNATLVREAHTEFSAHREQVARDKHQRKILSLWKKLFVGILTKERLEREYGDDDESD